MDIIIMVGLAIGLIIVLIIAVGGFIALDVMSYTATGSETLNPPGIPVGNALIVYNPGVTGAAKNAADEIAIDLRSKGYKVELAGVRSVIAANTSDYDIIIVGGPMYFGKISNSIDTYLKTLTLQKEVKLGVFGTTGSDQLVAEDLESLKNQVASLQSGKNATIKLIRDRDEKNAAQDYEGLVLALTQ
ncbi:MAG: hypothetical protein PQ975_10020 [Methanobacterium sp.]|jgi:flavorubredoxin